MNRENKIVRPIEEVRGVYPNAISIIENDIEAWTSVFRDPKTSPEFRRSAYDSRQKLIQIRDNWVATGKINRTDEPQSI